MDTSARLLRLLSLLQSRPDWTGAQLAERCGVTDRTLRRDMNRLRELGYLIEAVTGPHGGYRLAAGGALPPLLLDDEEAVTVAMALRGAAEGALPGFEDSALSALAKIEQVLPGRLMGRMDALVGATVRPSGMSGVMGRVDVAGLVVMARACRAGERLRFGYIDAAGTPTERHVEPYRLVHLSRRWYLVARDRDRDAWRSFRVDRISEVRATGMHFQFEDPPDPLRFVSEGMAVGAYRHQARIVLLVSPEEAARMVPPTVGVLHPHDKGSLLIIGADELEWIARFLAGLPCGHEVVEPAELRDELAALGARLLDYSAPG